MSTPFIPSAGQQPFGVTGQAMAAKSTSQSTHNEPQSSFDAILRQQLNPRSALKVSAHAEARLQQRGVSLNAGDWSKVESAVNAARQKGSKDAYVVYGQVGLVVNVPNSTVITALEHGSQTVVTNIDSVVVV